MKRAAALFALALASGCSVLLGVSDDVVEVGGNDGGEAAADADADPGHDAGGDAADAADEPDAAPDADM